MSDKVYVKPRNCPLCNKDHFDVVETVRDLQFFVDNPSQSPRASYSQVHCRHCGLLYMNPSYTDEGFAVLFKLAGRSYGDGGERHEEQITWLERNKCISDQFSYMDIGCFEGDFLSAIPQKKELLGIDFDELAIERARQKPGLKNAQLLSGRFEEFDLNRIVDVFTMFHVLEHLPEPVAVLRRLAKHANSNTKLIVEVPILELGPCDDIHGFYSPQHLSHFSKHTLRQTLAQAGWEIENAEQAADYNGYRICAKLNQVDGLASFTKAPDLLLILNERQSYFGARVAIEECIRTIPRNIDLIIWGAGMHIEMLYQRTSLFEIFDLPSITLVDGDPNKQGETWRSVKIKDPNTLKYVNSWENSRLVISSYGGQESIVDDALSLGVPEENIIQLYQTVRSY